MTQDEIMAMWNSVIKYAPSEVRITEFAKLVAARDYERGFIDGMQKQMQSSVDKAVNRMAQPEQEPVAYLTKRKIGGTEGLLRADMVDKSAKNQETHDFIPLYTTPPQRTWVGLTEEDKKQMAKEANYHWEMTAGEYAERIGQLTEAKLKEKNGA